MSQNLATEEILQCNLTLYGFKAYFDAYLPISDSLLTTPTQYTLPTTPGYQLTAKMGT